MPVSVSADEREVHPALWGAEGVPDAARKVAAARTAAVKLAEERRVAHAAWREENRRNALKPGFEPAPEPRPGLDHDEQAQFAAALHKAETTLEAVVAANEGTVVDGLREWEAEAMGRVRALVGELDGICGEAARAGRALQTVASASHRARTRQPGPKAADLLYLARKGEDVALLDFGDGRPNWLQVTGRG